MTADLGIVNEHSIIECISLEVAHRMALDCWSEEKGQNLQTYDEIDKASLRN
jgi:hypothetical protein